MILCDGAKWGIKKERPVRVALFIGCEAYCLLDNLNSAGGAVGVGGNHDGHTLNL